jgi:hypothetical protein
MRRLLDVYANRARAPVCEWRRSEPAILRQVGLGLRGRVDELVRAGHALGFNVAVAVECVDAVVEAFEFPVGETVGGGGAGLELAGSVSRDAFFLETVISNLIDD